MTAITTSARSTMKHSRTGSGAYWASSPARSGPQPRPPMLTTVVSSVARPRGRSATARLTTVRVTPATASAIGVGASARRLRRRM